MLRWANQLTTDRAAAVPYIFQEIVLPAPKACFCTGNAAILRGRNVTMFHVFLLSVGNVGQPAGNGRPMFGSVFRLGGTC